MFIKLLKKHIVVILILITSTSFSQLYNKEVVAKITIEDKSEFFTFTATAENLTPSDRNLRYQFYAYKTDENNNISKSGQENRFYLKANELQVLATTTLNSNFDSKIVLLLVIYDDEKPIGQDRIEANTLDELKILIEERAKIEINSLDQTNAQDGFTINGLVIEKTLTKPGRDFYKYFGLKHYNRKIKTGKNILVEEVPGFRARTTVISVKVDGQLVWRFFSRPTRKFLEEMAETAINRVITYLQRLEQNAENSQRY